MDFEAVLPLVVFEAELKHAYRKPRQRICRDVLRCNNEAGPGEIPARRPRDEST
jgi:hypothetical protein